MYFVPWYNIFFDICRVAWTVTEFRNAVTIFHRCLSMLSRGSHYRLAFHRWLLIYYSSSGSQEKNESLSPLLLIQTVSKLITNNETRDDNENRVTT